MQLQRIFTTVALGVFLLPVTLKAQQDRIIVSNSKWISKTFARN